MNYILHSSENIKLSEVGGKFYRQKKLIDSGFKVPHFFCLSIRLFQKVSKSIRHRIEYTTSSINFDNHRSIFDASVAIQNMYQQLEFSKQDIESIYEAFDEHFDLNDLVSVRASMIGTKTEESEDSAKNPFAGLSESFLYVKRDQIIGKIKACFSSGFSQEALLYRHKQGFDLMAFGIAVGIQKMVFGSRSFVMFTSDPQTAAKDVIIAAGYGIGEGIVQEKVEIDHFTVNANTDEIQENCVFKARQLGFDSEKGYGLKTFTVKKNLADMPCLNKTEINCLVNMGRHIEKIFSEPQDIEGCITENGVVYFLQTRPIGFDYDRQVIWTNANVTESFPGVTTALTYSFSRFFYRTIFHNVYRLLNVPSRQLHNNYHSLDKMIGFIHGHVYYRLTSFYLLHRQSPLFPIFRKHWESMMGFSSSFQTHKNIGLKARWNKWYGNFLFAKASISFLVRFACHENEFRKFHQWWEKLISANRGNTFEEEDPIVLINLFNKIWTEVGNRWGITLLNDTYLPMLYGLLEKQFSYYKLNEDPSLFTDLMCGGEQLQSVEIVLSAVNLAQSVRTNTLLTKLFREKDEHELYDVYKSGKLDIAFSEKIQHHLHYYGDRGLQELKIEQPNLRSTPWILFRMIKQYAAQNTKVEDIRHQEEKVREAADKKLDRLMAGKLIRKMLIIWQLKKLRTLIRNRENSRYCRSELFGFSKNIFNAMASYYKNKKILDNEEDIYHLTHEEIFGYVDGTGVTDNLQALANIRKEEFNQNKNIITPQDITTVGPIRQNVLSYVEMPYENEEGILQGLGSSSGKVKGYARVVIDPNTPIGDTKNMILIARETDPGWMFLMMASKGIVVEKGSKLSHTAITGRKFGIPTVVSLSRATKRIPDGAYIEIDGKTGRVVILDAKHSNNKEEEHVA